MKTVAAQCCWLVLFFTSSTKYMKKLQELMEGTIGKRLGFIKKGDTRWYSQQAMVRRILDLKPSLISLRNAFVLDTELHQTTRGRDFIRLLHRPRFREQAAMMRTLLCPQVLQLGHKERRAASFFDVAASFGGLSSFFSATKKETATLPSGVATPLTPLFPENSHPSPPTTTFLIASSIVTHLQWRSNFFYHTDLSVLVHTLDPIRHLQGLRSDKNEYASKGSVLSILMLFRSRLGLPSPGTDDSDTTDSAMDYLDDGTAGDLMAVEIGTTSDEEHRVLLFERWASCPTYVGTPLPDILRPLLSIPANVAELECVWSAMGLENNKSSSRLDMMCLTTMTRVCVKTREEAAATMEKAKTYAPGCLYSLSTSSGADTLDEEDVDDPSSIFGALSVYQELVLRGDTAAVDETPGGRNAEDQTMEDHLTEAEQSTQQLLLGVRQDCGGPPDEAADEEQAPLHRASSGEELLARFAHCSEGSGSLAPRSTADSEGADGPAGRRYRNQHLDRPALLRDMLDMSWYWEDSSNVYPLY